MSENRAISDIVYINHTNKLEQKEQKKNYSSKI